MDEILDRLFVPSLTSSYTEVAKDEQICLHREQSVEYLHQLKTHLELFSDVTVTHKQLAKAIAVLLQFSYESDWSTEGHETISTELIGCLSRILKLESLDQVLSLDETSVHSKLPLSVFQIFLQKVEKKSFELNPAACHACNELILRTSGRKIASCLGLFLPFTLNLLDHFLPANKIRGMKLLAHILDNITSSELVWCGLGDVFYETLHRLLFSNDGEILENLYPVLFSLLSKTNRNPAIREAYSDWTRYDDVITLTLQHMRYESSVKNQRVFMSAIQKSVKTLKFAICKHLTLIVHVLSEYCDGSVVLTRELLCNILDIFAKLTHFAPKQMVHYVEKVLKTVLTGIDQYKSDPLIEQHLNELLKIMFESDPNLTECLLVLSKDQQLCNLSPSFHSSLKSVINR